MKISTTRQVSICRTGLAALGLLVMVAAPASGAAVRSNANYAMQFDTIGSGVTAMSSTSYAQPQAECGQVVIWNNYVNSNFDFQPVGTFLFGSPSGIANFGWLNY